MSKFTYGQRVRIVSDSPDVFDTEGSEWLIGEIGYFYQYESDGPTCWVIVDGAPFPMMERDIEAAPTPEDAGQLPLQFAADGGEGTR